MKKTFFMLVIALFAMNAMANRILWAALDENSTIDGIGFRSYVDPNGHEVNAARLSIGSDVNYAMETVQQLSLWIPSHEGDPGYWEKEFPVTCLKDEDGEYPMGEWSSQFELGDDPNTATRVFFELGYVADWDDFDSPFVTLATASDTIGSLISGNYTYVSAIPWGPEDVDTEN